MRAAHAAAGVLVAAAAGMAALAFSSGGDEPRRRAAPGAPTAETAQTAPAPASRGKAVWVEQGCASCHTFAPADATGTLGPDLAASLRGTDAAYIRRSIVDPAAAAAAGFTTGMMPDDYAQRMSPAELEALVAFVARGVRD